MLRIETVESLSQQLTACIDDLEQNMVTGNELQGRLVMLEEASAQMQDDMALLKGLIQVQDKQITQNKSKIVDLTARSMSNNITIHGIKQSKDDEDCKQLVLNFLHNQMKMEIEDEEVETAHRIGPKPKQASKSRLMVMRCQTALQQRIFKFTKNLKGIKNEDDEHYYINQQLPEPLLTEKREREEKLREVRDANLKETDKTKQVLAEIKNKTLYLNHVPKKTHIHFPTAQIPVY